jgi:DNA-binding transcriptional regulator LsrR (DeoR family)
MPRARRWHPAQEKDELVFAVCNRFLDQLGRPFDPHTEPAEGGRKGAASAIADWLREEWGRADLTREKIYPLFWEAARRNFLFLKPPREQHLAERIADRYDVPQYFQDDQTIQVVNARGHDAPRHVASAGADLVLSLIQKLGKKKKTVHVGLGAGLSAMMVAKRLAHRIYSDVKCPELVLHALSAGGFLVDQPQKAPITYFAYFDGALTKVDCVALFSETVVSTDEYERMRNSPGVAKSFERAKEVDIILTSFASAKDKHGMLGQFLEYLIKEEGLESRALKKMREAGWVGDVQFRPYSSEGPMTDNCPVRAVTLFELSDLVRTAQTEDKHVVLLAGPCGECGRLKTDALLPLLTRPELRVWSHLVTDLDTARELLG